MVKTTDKPLPTMFDKYFDDSWDRTVHVWTDKNYKPSGRGLIIEDNRSLGVNNSSKVQLMGDSKSSDMMKNLANLRTIIDEKNITSLQEIMYEMSVTLNTAKKYSKLLEIRVVDIKTGKVYDYTPGGGGHTIRTLYYDKSPYDGGKVVTKAEYDYIVRNLNNERKPSSK